MSRGLDYLINLRQGSMAGATNARNELRGIDAAVENTGRNANNLGGIFRRVGGIMAGAFAIGQLISLGSESLSAYQAGFVKSSAQVEAAIVSTNGAAGKSLSGLRDMADDLESRTLFDDSALLTSQSLLLTFTNIKGAVFDQAIPAIADMAQRMAGDGPADLKGASIQVGKALNDPIKGITALSRVGVSFTESQKHQIEQMVKTGNTAGAQALILRELNAEFGGSAEAARNALGPQGDYNYLIGEMKEGIGSLVSDGLAVALPYVNGFVQSIRDGVEWIKENMDLVKTLGIEIGTAAGAYVVASSVMGVYNAYQAATATGTTIWTLAQEGLNAAFMANPIGMIIGGIALLVTGFTIAYKKSETFRAGIDGLIEVGKLLGQVFMAVGKTIVGALTFDKSMFMQGITETAKVTEEILGGGIQRAFSKGFDASKAKSRAAEMADSKQSSIDSLVPKAGGKKSIGLAGGSSGKSDSTSVSSSKQVRNVSVQIGKLVENLTIATTNLQGASAADIKRQITELFVSMVHDSELALSSS